jgi:signal peptidase
MNGHRWKKAGALMGKSILVLLTAAALLLTFFLLKSKLTGTEPAVAGHKIYIVMSGSMEPALQVGSIVLVRPLAAEEIRPGDIVTFRNQYSPDVVSHRVHHVEEEENGLLFYTKGDANEVLDPLPVPARLLVGKVVLTVPYLGYLFAYARSREGQMLLLGLAVLITAGELARVYLAAKRQGQRAGGGKVNSHSAAQRPGE